MYLKYRFWLLAFFSMASSEPMPLYFFSRTPSEKKYSPGASVVAANRDPIITADRKHLFVSCKWTFISFSTFPKLLQVHYNNNHLSMPPGTVPSPHGRPSGCPHLRWQAPQTSERTLPPCTRRYPEAVHMPWLQGSEMDTRQALWLVNVWKE